MISYEEFSQRFNSGEISKLNFYYESKEYVMAREENETGLVFVFASEEREAIRYPSVAALLKYAIIGDHSLREIWYHITPICYDTLLDDDYVVTQHSDSLGKITSSVGGTLTAYDSYLMLRLLPSMIVWVLAVVVLLLCTLFVPTLSWIFFAVAVSISVAALGITQLIFWSNTKKYRQGNPNAHLYLMENGVVLLTNRAEHAIPYTKIRRLDTEAGICISTLLTVYIFVAGEEKGIAATLKNTVDEIKANRRKKPANPPQKEQTEKKD